MNSDEPQTILIVEDEAIISIVTSKSVKRFGYNVICANSGERAVELAAENEAISLILMDIELGTGIDGTEAAQRILAIRDIPIVFHTSHSEREMVERVRGITRYGYVIKSSGDFVLQSSIEMAYELVEAKKKVKASEEHFYGLFEKAPLGYQSLDENGYFIEVNQSWLDTLGYSREEVVGKWFGDFLAPEFTDAFRERFPIFKAAGKIHSEFQMMHKNGERRYIAFEGRIGYKDDGSFMQTHCILSDITERKIAEEELWRTRAILQAAMDQSPAGIAIADAPDGKLRYVNDAGLLIRGGDRQAIVDGIGISDYVAKWKILDLDGRPLETDEVPLARAVLYGDTNSREFIIRRSDADDRIVLANAAPIRDERGNVESGIVVFTDITERKRAESELQNKNRELTVLNEELNATIEEMEATNEEFAAANERLIESEREIERSEEKFRQMFFQHQAVMLLIDPESGFIIDANSSAEAFYGYDLSDFRRMRIQDINILSPEEIAGEMQRAKERQGNYFVFPHRLANSEIRTVEVYSSPVTINMNTLLFSIIHDITDRINAQKALMVKDWAIDSAINPVAISDLDGTLSYVNPAFLKLWGFLSTEDVLGRPATEFWQTGEKAAEVIEKLHSDGGWSGELTAMRNDGFYFNVQVAASMVTDSESRPVCMLASFAEITDSKNSEQKLRTVEELYSMALTAVDDGIWDWHVPDGKAYFSDQYYRMLGYADNEFTACYDSWRALVHPEDIDRVERDLTFSADRGEKFNIDLRMKMKSGEWLWVCTRGKAVEWDAEGKAVRMVGTLSDVTLRKNAELELMESQVNLKRIIENSSDLICEIDEKGKYTFVSERYKALLGYSPDELLGRYVIEKMHPEDIENVKSKFITLISDIGVSVDEWRFMHKKSSYHTFECRSSVYIYRDGRPRMVVISHDITESKRIEDAQQFLIAGGSYLPEKGDFFQSLARYIAGSLEADFVCIDKLIGNGLSARTLAVFTDGEFEDNIEYTLKDTPCGVAAGKTICTFKENVRSLFPEDAVLQEMSAESYAGVTLWSSTGEPIGLIAVIWRKKMEDIHIAESVLKMVGVRAAGELERRDAEEKIKSLLKEKELLLREVHHRIKNNMNTMYGLLSLQAEAMDVPAAADALNDAVARIQSMMVLYDKLYRSDAFTELSVKDYLPALIGEVVRNFPQSNIVRIEKHIDDFVMDVKTLVPLGIIVNELLTNTMKYAFKGLDSGLISVSVSEKDNRATLVIADNGIGIPESVSFENSTGFGMQLVSMLTEQIGGIIRIERGDGTRFILEFEV